MVKFRWPWNNEELGDPQLFGLWPASKLFDLGGWRVGILRETPGGCHKLVLALSTNAVGCFQHHHQEENDSDG